jgi:hypothetical protein
MLHLSHLFQYFDRGAFAANLESLEKSLGIDNTVLPGEFATAPDRLYLLLYFTCSPNLSMVPTQEKGLSYCMMSVIFA